MAFLLYREQSVCYTWGGGGGVGGGRWEGERGSAKEISILRQFQAQLRSYRSETWRSKWNSRLAELTYRTQRVQGNVTVLALLCTVPYNISGNFVLHSGYKVQ